MGNPGDGVGGGSTVGGTGGTSSGSGGSNGAGRCRWHQRYRGATGTAGMSGADAGTPNMPPVMPVAGVVQGGVCFPLCLTSGRDPGRLRLRERACRAWSATLHRVDQHGLHRRHAVAADRDMPRARRASSSSNQCVALCGAEVQDDKDATRPTATARSSTRAASSRAAKVATTRSPCKTGAPIGDGGAASGPGRLLDDAARASAR